jgi:hypothetical protein
MFTNIVTHVCFHENINLTIHALLVYVISSGLGVFNIDIPIGLFELSMVLRSKWPSLIKI